MLSFQPPSGIRRLADRYKDLFVGRSASYNNLSALMCLFLYGCESVSELVRRCPWSHSCSDISRAIQCFDSNRSMRRLRSSILRHYKGDFNVEDFCFAIDDTANPKYGKNIYRSGRWHSSSGPYVGQKILVLALVDFRNSFALPLAFIILPKKNDPHHISAPKLAITLLRQALDAGFARLPVTTDSWFDSTEFISDVEQLGLTFVGELKGNRKIKTSPGPKSKWSSIKHFFGVLPRNYLRSCFDNKDVINRKKVAKSVAQSRIFIRKRRSALNGIAVYNRRNGTKAFAYYASTDLSMSGSKIWEITRARWKIECLFRDLKQHLSFGRLPAIGEKAADLAVCIPFLLLVSLRLDGERNWELEKSSTIGTMVDQIREASLNKSIEVLLCPGTNRLKKNLQGRRQLHRLNSKPVDEVAEAA